MDNMIESVTGVAPGAVADMQEQLSVALQACSITILTLCLAFIDHFSALE